MGTPEQPIQPEVKASMNLVAKAISTSLPPGYGFALLVFDRGGSGFMNYISNSDRADMLKALKEFIANAEGS